MYRRLEGSSVWQPNDRRETRRCCCCWLSTNQ